MTAIGVLASGRGSNFQSLIDHAEKGMLNACINVLITDNPGAYAIERAKRHRIEALCLEPRSFPSRDAFYEAVRDELRARSIDLVVLAGFMRIVRKPLIDAFQHRIMNIHPALLPSFPGLHGQEQAVRYGVKISGCTVHFVDEGVDTGPIIAQAAVPVYPDDTEDSLSERILKEEHRLLPYAVRLFADNRLTIKGKTVIIENIGRSELRLANPPF